MWDHLYYAWPIWGITITLVTPTWYLGPGSESGLRIRYWQCSQRELWWSFPRPRRCQLPSTPHGNDYTPKQGHLGEQTTTTVLYQSYHRRCKLVLLEHCTQCANHNNAESQALDWSMTRGDNRSWPITIILSNLCVWDLSPCHEIMPRFFF